MERIGWSTGMTVATTGIAGLDAQLGGGIPRGTTLLLVGEPGNALSLFSSQFAGGGLDAGEDVHYFLFDRPSRGMREVIQGFSTRGGERKAHLTIYDGYASQFSRAGASTLVDQGAQAVQAPYALPFILNALSNESPTQPYRVVVETLSTVTRPETEREVLDFVRSLVYHGHELGGLHMISIVKGLHSPEFETQLRHLVGGVLEFGVERKGFGLYNYLLITKLLNVPDPVRILLWKETEKGLWLESTKRVF